MSRRPARGGRMANPALKAFLHNQEDAIIGRRHVCDFQSSLGSSADGHDDWAFTPEGVGTSRMAGGSRITTHGSLPAMTHGPDRETTAGSSDAVQVEPNVQMRLLETRDGETFVAPSPQHAMLECPCPFLRCFTVFAIHQEDAWLRHSLSHFVNARPPQNNACPFCDETFHDQDGMVSWTRRMTHVARHHELGHRLAHGRPDFSLFQHMWTLGVLSRQDYRELFGPTSSPLPSSPRPRSPSRGGPPDLGASYGQAGAYTVINENGRRRRRRP